MRNCQRPDSQAPPRRNHRANSLREIRSVIRRLRRVVDPRTWAQLLERQIRIYQAHAVEIAIDKTVDEMAQIDAPRLAGDPRIADDVDRAIVRQQMVEFRPIRKLVDSMQVDSKE